jgi:hypothetical protein
MSVHAAPSRCRCPGVSRECGRASGGPPHRSRPSERATSESLSPRQSNRRPQFSSTSAATGKNVGRKAEKKTKGFPGVFPVSARPNWVRCRPPTLPPGRAGWSIRVSFAFSIWDRFMRRGSPAEPPTLLKWSRARFRSPSRLGGSDRTGRPWQVG